MLDGISLPVICAANHGECQKWFVHLKSLMNHPILKEEEKLLWMWLATCSASNQSLWCSMSIEQISQMISKPEKVVHRCLLRLKIMGLLIGDIPIWYGEPTPEMVKAVRKMKLVLMEREFQAPVLVNHRLRSQIPPLVRTSGPLCKVGTAGSLPASQMLRRIKREPFLMKNLSREKPLIPDKQWVRGMVKFVKENHNWRLMFRRMIH